MSITIKEIGKDTLTIPEFYAVSKPNGRWRLVNALTPTGKLKTIKGQNPIKIIAKPTKHAILMEHTSEHIPINLFSKADQTKIHAHFSNLPETPKPIPPKPSKPLIVMSLEEHKPSELPIHKPIVIQRPIQPQAPPPPPKKKAGRPRVLISDADREIIHRHFKLLEHPKTQNIKPMPSPELTKLSKDFNNVRKRVAPQEYMRSKEFDEFKKSHASGSGILDFAKTLVYGRTDYPQDQKNLIGDFGEMVVRHIRIERTPLPTLLNTAINLATLGAFKKALNRSPYDKLYHLFIILTLDNGKTMLLEKNAAINMQLNPPTPPKGTTYLDVNAIPSTLTFKLLLENTKTIMGLQFFPYDSIRNNCQDFILNIFKANHLLTQPIVDFVKQDVNGLFKNFNNTKKLMNVVTNLGGVTDIAMKGGRLNQSPVLDEYGKIATHLVSHVIDPTEPLDKRDAKHSIELIDKIQKIRKRSGKKSHKNVSRMPKFVKGSEEAKEHMRKMREMRGCGLEGNAGVGGHKLGMGIGAGMESESDSDSDSSDEGEGTGLYVGGRGIGAGVTHVHHYHTHNYYATPDGDEMTGGKINWKKVGNTAWKIAKPVVKEVSHKYLPKLGETAGIALGSAAATLSGNPEMAPIAGEFGAKIGKTLGKTADKKIQGLGIGAGMGAGIRKGRFAKGSEEALAWAKKMREARGKK
jgi:hypothetical protein